MVSNRPKNSIGHSLQHTWKGSCEAAMPGWPHKKQGNVNGLLAALATILPQIPSWHFPMCSVIHLSQNCSRQSGLRQTMNACRCSVGSQAQHPLHSRPWSKIMGEPRKAAMSYEISKGIAILGVPSLRVVRAFCKAGSGSCSVNQLWAYASTSARFLNDLSP